MTAVGVAIYGLGLARVSRLILEPTVPWVALVLGYLLVNIAVAHVHGRSGAHTVTLSELPLIFGLIFASPGELIAAGVLGTATALVLVRRQPIIKLTFNLALITVEVEAAVVAYRLFLSSASPMSVRGWGVAVAAAGISSLVSTTMVTWVMNLGVKHGYRALPKALAFALAVSLLNTLVALAGVHMMLQDPIYVVLLVVPGFALWVAYRGNISERRRHRRVQVLYETSRAFQASADFNAVVRALLSRAHEAFNAEIAELTLLPVGSEGLINRYYLEPPEHERLIAEPSGGDTIDAVAVQERTRVIPRGRARDAMPADLVARGVRDAMVVALRVEGGVFGSMLVANRRSDVDTFDHEDVDLLEAFATLASVSLDKSRLGDELQRLAFHDILTGLPNRALLVQRLGRTLLRAADEGSQCAVLFIDIDDFKFVNDSLGHQMGDRLLAAVALRVLGCLRTSDTAARLGGDEFAVLLDGAHDEDVAALASRLVHRLGTPFVIDGTRLIVHVSIGAAVNRASTRVGAVPTTAEEVLSNADVAMYRAKTKGKNQWQVFEASMQTEALERMSLQRDLERAVEDRQFVVHYQPVVTLPDGAVVGVEALVRWRHPTRGLVEPDQFIHAAEENGLIVPIGDFVLRTACAQLAVWHRLNPELVLNVNISGRQLVDLDFFDRVAAILRETGIDPADLELEITESVMVLDDPSVRDALGRLRNLGVRLAIDDFGTGYSSLSTLRELPVDVIKIAKPFVDGIDSDTKDLGFVTAIVRLAHTLDLAIIAEGVERASQAERLTELRCGMAQGWLYSPALPASELIGVSARSGVDARRLGAGTAPGSGSTSGQSPLS